MEGIDVHLSGGPANLPAEAVRHVSDVARRMRRGEDSVVLEGGSARRRVVLSAATIVPSEGASPPAQRVRLTGRLLEIAYRDRSAEVWDPFGRMTRFRFSEEQRGQVDAARQQQVEVEGVIEPGPSGRTGLTVLERLNALQSTDSFWRSPSLSELAQVQGVGPMADPASLVADFWQEDDEADFLSAVRRWRDQS